MRLDQIQKRKLITEGWNDSRLTLLETQHIIPFVSSIERYITETQLTPDQISQLFANVEQGATAAGGNRTLLGKGKDAASFINKKIDELGAQLKKAGPVQNADAKFKELKAKIGATDSKVAKAIQGVSDWAVANPGKASIAVGILTTAAAMAGGPMGGAIAGFIARATKDLLQGADLSTAIGKSLKTAAYGAIAGWAMRGVGDWLEGLRVNAIDYPEVPGLTQIDVGLEKTLTAPGFNNVKTLGSILVPPERAEQFISLAQAAKGGDVDAFNKLWNFSKSFDVKQYNALTNATNDMIKAVVQQNDAFLQNLTLANDAIAAIAQGTASGKIDADEVKVDGKPLQATESKKFTALQVETIIEWCDDTPAVILNEGPLDAIKKGAAAVGGAVKKGAAAVGAKAAKVGKNMTTKVTADKLNSAWKKAGSPTDSDAIANILRQQGVSDEVLAPVYKQMGAKLPAAPAADAGTPGQTGGTTAKPAADAGTPGQTGGTTAKPAADAAAPMDFKGIQQAVAKLSQQDAKALVTHIDSLNKSSGSQPKAATQGQTAPTAGGQQPAQATQAPQADPTATDTTAPAQGGAAPAADKNAAAGDTYEKAKGDIRKVQGGTKPMPPKTAAGIDADLAKLAKGDKESGVAAAQKIMNFAKAGVDVSKQQQAWIANSKAGERFLTQSEYFELSKMMREHNLSWSDLGIRVHLLEGTNKLFGISFK